MKQQLKALLLSVGAAVGLSLLATSCISARHAGPGPLPAAVGTVEPAAAASADGPPAGGTVASGAAPAAASDVAAEPPAEPLMPIRLDDESWPKDVELPARNLAAPSAGAPPALYDLPMDMTRNLEQPDRLVKVTLAWDAADMRDVVDQFSVILDFQYYLDPGVGGTVNMTMDTEMTVREAWALFEHILWVSGAYASRNNGFLHIVPFAKMPQERRLFATHDPIPNVTVEMIRLFHTSPADIATQIKPFMTEGATATPVAHLNALMLVEAPPNMPKLRELVQQLDVMGETRWPQISVRCRYVDVTTVVEELKLVLPVLGFPVSGDKGDGHSLKIVDLPRHQILIAAAPTREVLDEIRSWVNVLDREDSGEEERVYFYDVKYNKAEDLSDAVSVFFTASSTAKSARRSSTGSNTDSTTNTSRRSATTARQPTAVSQTVTKAPRRNGEETTPQTVFDIPVTIFADGAHNRLVMRTTPRAHAMLEALLRRLDTPAQQVLIQLSIAEIQLTKNTEFGFAYAISKVDGSALGDAATLAYDAVRGEDGSFSASPGTGLGLTFSKSVGPETIFSLIRAVAGEGNTRVLFSPQVIAISDEEAMINVGDRVPVVSEFIDTSTTGSGNLRSNVQYQDTGIILTVTPHITAKKLVTLDLKQEVSDAVETKSSSIDSPTIQTRVLETSLVVEDGTTVLLGGLISSRDVNTNSGVPFLKEVPYLGRLFSLDSTEQRRQELLMMITVHVMDVNADIEKLLARYKAAVEALNQVFGEPPVGEMRSDD